MSENFTMPFGKFKGRKLKDVEDLTYLDWMIGLDNLYPETRQAIENYLEQPEVAKELKVQLQAKESN